MTGLEKQLAEFVRSEFVKHRVSVECVSVVTEQEGKLFIHVYVTQNNRISLLHEMNYSETYQSIVNAVSGKIRRFCIESEFIAALRQREVSDWKSRGSL